MNNEELVQKVTAEILKNYSLGGNEAADKSKLLPIAVSNRHLHVSEADFKILFGDKALLTKQKDLSQPGQYAANEVVTLIGCKGIFQKVRILGPYRVQTQVEVSRTDSYVLGINPPVRDSGDLAGSEKLVIVGPAGAVTLKEGVIIACRHIHFTVRDAMRLGVTDKQKVRVRTFGGRALIFGEVLCRVSDKFALEMHVDTDEGNSALIKGGELVEIVN
ncbi:MAG: phosphate propanoyltransferase [Candidatus Wallbacteria bacterium]|nr:phosphate propanoyltransferase [Candidatus Wallbacteria bacterium]